MSGLAAALSAALGGTAVTALTPVAGGDVNEAYAAELADGRRAFVKTRAAAAPGAFAAEAAGLRWLGAAPDGLPVPEVLAAGDTLLALAWVPPGRLDAAGEEALGRGLAATHRAGAEAFGSTGPGDPDPGRLYLASLVLPNGPAPTWAAFCAQRRIAPLALLAERRGALPPGARADLDAVCLQMEGLAGPPEPPARTHGDLWSGNVLADAGGQPWLIDPAAHGGHREADLALLRLFGGPSERAYAAYAEAFPLADGHAERVELWQLVPLLLHAVLFGGSYGTAVARIAARYAR